MRTAPRSTLDLAQVNSTGREDPECTVKLARGEADASDVLHSTVFREGSVGVLATIQNLVRVAASFADAVGHSHSPGGAGFRVHFGRTGPVITKRSGFEYSYVRFGRSIEYM